MKIRTLLCSLLLPALFVWSAAVSAQPPAQTSKANWPTHLRFLTGPTGGQWFVMGDPIAEVLTREVVLTTSRMGGGVSNISDINTKLGDLGFSLSCLMGAGQSGEEEYKSIAAENTVIMANIYPQVLYFLLRKDFALKHGIDSVEALLKKNMPLRFASLKPGTASEFILSLLFRHGYDTSFDKLRGQGWEIFFNNYRETADNFVSGDLDCFAYTAGTTVPLIRTIEEYTEVTVLPVQQDVLDKLAAKFGTHTYTIEPGTYKSVTSPVRTLGDYTCIVIRKDLPDDIVFAINKALWENKQSIAGVISDFGGLAPATALPQGLPVHPGSVTFWRGLLPSAP